MIFLWIALALVVGFVAGGLTLLWYAFKDFNVGCC